jgi:hypothetical protein
VGDFSWEAHRPKLPGMNFVNAINIQYREVRTCAPPKRSRGSSALYAVIAGCCAFGAAVAAVLYVGNRSRLQAYQADALCRAALISPAVREGSACSVDYARIVDRWVSWHRSTGYYYLGLRAPDGGIDSVELKGAWRKNMWDMSPMGASLLVQRYQEAHWGRRRVTLVRTPRAIARTQWNPAWHADDTMGGVVFMSGAALIALIAFVRKRASLTSESSTP